jgi:hypothetical protein
MRIGQVFRYSRPYSSTPAQIDGLVNFFHATSSYDCKKVLLDAGINKPTEVSSADGQRESVVLLRSSPHKIGSEDTPWQDYFNPDNGHIRYFGDNKNKSRPASPETSLGNNTLLKQFDLHSSTKIADRLIAAPILCFRSVRFNGKNKGAVKFEGFGLIDKIERVVQYDGRAENTFTNFAYDIVIFDMSAENETFDWSWITARRNKTFSATECLKLAPASWKKWVAGGDFVLREVKRTVSKLMTTKTRDQKPTTANEIALLQSIYRYYDGRKSRFEALAALVAERIISHGNANTYKQGWITSAGADGGADFVGRLDIGFGFSTTKLIVLGQAKCEKLDTPTSGNHIARTVARLRRGWVGVYVTTSYFSEAVQREVIEDKYPILLINGLIVCKEVYSMMHEQGIKDVNEFLDNLDQQFESMISIRQPEEILLD